MRFALVVCVSAALVARASAGEGEAVPVVTRAPALTRFVEAAYPAEQKAAGLEAEVLLAIEVDERGHVGVVEVTTSAGPAFDAAAVAAAKQFVFSPGEVDGKPAPVKVSYRYAFKIRTEVVKLGPQVNLDGVVQERFSKRPMAGVRVTIVDLDQRQTTDAEGKFEFVDVPVGTHKVQLSGDRLVTVSTDEVIEPGKKKSVRYRAEEKVDGVDEERVTRAPRIKKESVETTIRTEEARRIPGTQGDTLKVVQNLPGVARSSVGSGALVVWGAAPRETKVNLDGVEIPALYHVGGMRSTVNGELVRSIELAPGGFGADYGRGLGGLVKIETRNLPDRGIHGYAQADAIDASALVSAAIGKRLRVAVAARYSYLNPLVGALVKSDNNGRSATDIVPVPVYYDYQVHAQLRLRTDEMLEAILIASNDVLDRNVPSDDPSNVRSERTEQTFYRALLRYSRLYADGSSVTVTPSFGWDDNARVQRFGLVPVEQSSTAYRYGLRATYRRKVARIVTLSAGLDLQGAWQRTTRSGSLSQPPREGDFYVFGQAPGDDVNADRWINHTVDVAPWVFAELALGKKISLTPGLRLDTYYLEGDRASPVTAGLPPVGYARVRFAVDPRLQLTYRAHKRLTLTAAVGIYHQAPDAEDLSAVFGNPTLGLSRAIHTSLGANVKLTPTLSLEVVGFYKRLDDLVQRAEAASPPLAGALGNSGEGRAYGAQLHLRQELWKGFFGWLTYSISRSERLDHPNAQWRLFDFDQTHSLTLVASYEYKGWTFGTRLRYATGVPRSPVIGAYYDPRGDQYEPIFGRKNSIRIPDFVQLDLRVDKTITLRRVKLNVYLDAQNVTTRSNPEEIVYSYDYRKRGYISGLPILATLGLKVEW